MNFDGKADLWTFAGDAVVPNLPKPHPIGATCSWFAPPTADAAEAVDQ